MIKPKAAKVRDLEQVNLPEAEEDRFDFHKDAKRADAYLSEFTRQLRAGRSVAHRNRAVLKSLAKK